jgi:hypothetical protein
MADARGGGRGKHCSLAARNCLTSHPPSSPVSVRMPWLCLLLPSVTSLRASLVWQKHCWSLAGQFTVNFKHDYKAS